MSGEDPWGWSIDRVVQELCTSDRSWQPRATLQNLPALVGLESKLREQEIDGCILLADVDDAVMKDGLGLTKLAWKVFVRSAIENFRLRSVHYKQYVQQHHADSHLSFHRSASMATPNFQHLQPNQVPLTPPVKVQSPTVSNLSVAIRSLDGLQNGQGFTIPVDSRSARGEFIISDDLGNKRRKLDLTSSASNLALQSEDEALYEAQCSEYAGPPQFENENLTPGPDLTEVNGKKRKRIAPTLMSLELDPTRNHHLPTAADYVVQNDPQSIEPGVTFRGDDGRKRLVPIHQPDADSEEPYNYQVLLQKSKVPNTRGLDEGGDEALKAVKENPKNVERKEPATPAESLEDGYLGKKKMRVDEIFYNKTDVGHELSPSQDIRDFSEGRSKVSSGRRIYVHHLMRRYLSSEGTLLLRDGKYFTAVQPYRSSLIPRHEKPSFTLFFASEDGQIHARREETQSWPEIDQGALTYFDGNHVVFNTPPGMIDVVGSYEPCDPEVLWKHEDTKGGEEVLPRYGDSDEDEQDAEVWRQIEAEQDTPERSMKLSVKKTLTIKEVNDALGEAITKMVVEWNKRELPTKKHSAFKIWKKYRPESLRLERLRQRKLIVDYMNQRVADVCKEIIEQQWSSIEQVLRQSGSLEESIFEREECAWEIRLLESRSQPEKLQPLKALQAVNKSNARTDHDSEGESHSDAFRSNGSLDDFIDDTLNTEDENELGLANSKDDEDKIVTNVGLFPSKLPPARSPICSSQFSSQDPDELMPDAQDAVVGQSQDFNQGNLVKEEPFLSKLPVNAQNNCEKVVDLTMSSSDERVIDLVTPKKTPQKITLVNRNSPIPVSDSDNPYRPDADNLPALKEVHAIGRYRHQVWIDLGDRERLLVSVLYRMPVGMRDSIFTLTSDTQDQLWFNMERIMDSIHSNIDSVKGVDGATFETLCCIIQLFAMFVHYKYFPYREKPDKSQILGLKHARIKYPEFYSFCQKLKSLYEGKTYLFKSSVRQSQKNDLVDVDEDDDEDEEPRTANRRQPNSSSRAINQNNKRKKPVFENLQARDLREQDRLRLAAQEERRKKLQANLVKSGDPRNSQNIIINDSRLEEDGLIHVNREIASRIKPHQVKGIQFMWNQVVAYQNIQQGCLLAHTMGLGKTMQVITLLVAIADASSSDDKSVSRQIPSSLRQSKTLVLCPPGLIDNWMDELLTWAPKDALGNLRKVDTTVKILDRWISIDEWYHNGGVLVLGYEMFRNIIMNPKKAGQDTASIGDELHAKLKMQLTEGPNIIIADEAHKMKNAAATITIAASMFKSRSRIAMTGSPLANNVAEYHTMIEWVAPNYLGPAVEFRAKYVEPIQAGLYYDSTPSEYRKSLTILGALKETLSPKVHRADMSVLRNDLPPKTEFVITVPLTDLQRKAYSIYVRSMITNAARTKDGDITQATLWHWLAILSLLCNHPKSFMAKLTERKEDAKRDAHTSTPVSRDSTDQEDIGLDLNSTAWKVGVSGSLVRDEQKLFAEEVTNINSIELSNKMTILCQILDASKAVGDKALVFSASIPTLDFLEEMCQIQNRKYARLDGSTAIGKRQAQTKNFNTGNLEVFLISTTAGGLGLNLSSANRVVVFDFKFNPILEEQAVGRAYRITQEKEVFVYRFVVGGTFEDSVHNKAIFKKQLASRVVDKKNPIALATKKFGDFLFEPKDVQQKSLSEFKGKDPGVLDKILVSQAQISTIRAIVQSDTFEKDDNDALTIEEQKEANRMYSDEELKRTDLAAYHALLARRSQEQMRSATAHHPLNLNMTPPSINSNIWLPNYVASAQRSASGAVSTQPPPPAASTTPVKSTQSPSLASRPSISVHKKSMATQSLQASNPSIISSSTNFRLKSPNTPKATLARSTAKTPTELTVTAQHGNRSAKSSSPSMSMDGDEKSNQDKPTVRSEMLKAMSRRPSVQSLRTPVTKSSSKKTVRSPQSTEDTRPLRRPHEKPTIRNVHKRLTNQNQSLSPSNARTTPTPALSIPKSSEVNPQLPHWAKNNITEANSRNQKQGHNSAALSPTSTLKQ